MRWLRAHKKQGIILLAVLLLAGVLVGAFLSFGTDTWLGRATESCLQIVQKPLTAAGNSVRSFFYGFSHGKELQEENEALKAEIAELKKEIIDEALDEKELMELRSLKALLNAADLEEYEYVTTTVTALDRSNWFSSFTIGAGTKSGVQKDDVVVSEEGLVGRVISAGETWAKVLSVIHDSNNVSFKDLRDMDIIGIATGDGEGLLTGYLLDTDADIREGDTVITSGMELYPEGIPIGEVIAFSQDKDSQIIYVTIRPFADFETLSRLTVIRTQE